MTLFNGKPFKKNGETTKMFFNYQRMVSAFRHGDAGAALLIYIEEKAGYANYQMARREAAMYPINGEKK